MVYQFSLDYYEKTKESNAKKIYVDDKLVVPSACIDMNFANNEDLYSSLGLSFYYSSDECEKMTRCIPSIDEKDDLIAILPSFKDDKLIDKMKELKIITDVVSKELYKGEEYRIAKINLEELREYCPFDHAVIDDKIKSKNRKQNMLKHNKEEKER